MAGMQTLIDCWIPRAKKSRLDKASSSEMLVLCGEDEALTSLSTTNDLLVEESALDSTDLVDDVPTLEADTSSSDYCGADTPTSEVSSKCDVEFCKEGYTGKPFRASN